MCFGQHIWIPHTLVEDGQLIKLFDSAYHEAVENGPLTPQNGGIIKTTEHDRHWARIRRPTVVVGGELTMDNLENRHDFLTLATGRKFQVPFEQLIIFSTNLEPQDLVPLPGQYDAFLRRIPYKIEIADATEEEFHELFRLYVRAFRCEYRKEVVDHLVQKHYRPLNRPMRRCQPRDLLTQIQNYCRYNDLTMEMRPEYFDHVVKSYFTVVSG